MAHKHERSDWYSGSFRRDSGGGALRRKHRGMRVTMLVLCVLILLVASSIIFRDRNEHAARQDILLPSPDSGFTNPRPDALPDSTEAPADPDDYEDFREFFRRYYSGEAASSVPKASGSSIRRAELTGDFLPELVSAEGREELSLTQLYKACADAVVGIRASANSFGYSWGSGVLISPKGYILTNQHILEGNRRAEVILTDGRKLEALLVGEDLFTDIAVLKVESETPLPWVELGDSEALSVGDRVVAIGNPISQELSGTMTDGIISAINRDITMEGRHVTLLQTNAAINEGNSGGPLLNLYGQVIGITNMKMVNFSSDVIYEGIGFAIPSVTVRSVAEQLLTTGAVKPRPGVGLTLGPVPEEARSEYQLPEGLYVSAVSRGCDAEAQGVLVGDIVTAVNGEPVRTTDDVVAIRDSLDVGDAMELEIFRDGGYITITIRLMDITKIY